MQCILLIFVRYSFSLLKNRVLPVIGYKICHVIEGIDSDYSRAWAWRTGTTTENQDNTGKHKTMGDGEHDDRFATRDELLC